MVLELGNILPIEESSRQNVPNHAEESVAVSELAKKLSQRLAMHLDGNSKWRSFK
jgi:hypothetical protein